MKLWLHLIGIALGQRCEPIKVGFCSSVQGSNNYNVFTPAAGAKFELSSQVSSILENSINYSQTAVETNFGNPGSAISALRVQGCHENLVPFICMYFLPVCQEDYPRPVYPCREVCESVKQKCLSRLQVMDFPWPQELGMWFLPYKI